MSVPDESDGTMMMDESEDAKATSNRPKRHFVCTVCGDAAMGYNFGAIVCESCKSFYRRHAHRRPKFRCLSNGTCQINKLTRRFCASCRLRQCFAAGMRKPPANTENRQQLTQIVWTAEKQNQRRLLMSRLLQRIAAQPTAHATTSEDTDVDAEVASPLASSETTQLLETGGTSCSSSCDNSDNIGPLEYDFDELHERISAAANIIQIRSVNSNESLEELEKATRPSDSHDAACVRLAFGNYVAALRRFPEFIRLGEDVHKLILSEHAIAQINLYAFFAVNDDITGWCAIGQQGVPCEHRFAEFVECMQRDGVDAKPYVQLFQSLAASIRSQFEHDWPIILFTVCLINLCSPSCRTSDLLELSELRKTYQSFLQNYLDRHYGSKSDALYHFCVSEFPNALAKLVDIQKYMLIQLVTQRSARAADKGEVKSSPCDITIASLRVADLFEPVISEVARHLTV